MKGEREREREKEREREIKISLHVSRWLSPIYTFE
jgi:hypothetical protein